VFAGTFFVQGKIWKDGSVFGKVRAGEGGGPLIIVILVRILAVLIAVLWLFRASFLREQVRSLRWILVA
jgi:hypothetical protein